MSSCEFEAALVIAAKRKHCRVRTAKRTEGTGRLRRVGTLSELLEHVGVCKQRTRDCHQVALAVRERTVDHIAVLKAAVGDHGDAHHTANGGSKIGIRSRLEAPSEAEQGFPDHRRHGIVDRGTQRGLLAQVTRGVDEGVEALIGIVAGAALRVGKAEAGIDMQIIDAQLLQPFRIVCGLGKIVADKVMARRPDEWRPRNPDIDRQPVEILCRQADAEQKAVPDFATHALHHVVQQLKAFLNRAAVISAAPIGERIEKLVKDIALRGGDFDTVAACVGDPARGLAEVVNDGFDIGFAHFDGAIVVSIQNVEDGGGGNSVFRLRLEAVMGVPAGIAELHDVAAIASRPDFLHRIGERLDETIGMQRGILQRRVSLLVDAYGRGNDRGNTALRKSLLEMYPGSGDRAVIVRRSSAHRRAKHPI